MKNHRWLASALLVLTLVFAFAGCTTQSVTTTVTVTDTPPQDSVHGSITDIEAALESIYVQAISSVDYIEVSFPGGGASGSGFVWDNDGNVVTNNHVVDGADRITVTFYDTTTVEASLVGQDLDSDLAVIRVDMNTEQYNPVVLADSTQLKVGQLVIAIGNPFGFQGTMTVGFISGLGRLLPVDDNTTRPNYSIPDVIQTDAAINPGNSGGVLLDTSGEVVGVTSSIVSTSGASAGVGFAIPSVIVQQVVPALINTGHYDHPYLGISIMSLNPGLAEAMNLPPDRRGALVQSITAGSPADEAGLRGSQIQATVNGQSVLVGGDVIISYNGKVVNTLDDLITFLARYGSAGQTVTLTVLRNGEEIQLQVTLGIRPG